MRVFCALSLPEAVLASLREAAAALKSRHPRLAVPRPEGMHLTLLFFGELPEKNVDRLRTLLDHPSLSVPIIKASLGGLGQFPSRGIPRVIWCGLGQGSGEVCTFYRQLRDLVGGEGGVPLEDREFHPHITLARNRGEAVGLDDWTGLPRQVEPFRIERCVLYQSILRRDGAEYRPLKTVRFKE